MSFISILKKLLQSAGRSRGQTWTTCNRCGGQVPSSVARSSGGLCSTCAGSGWPAEKSSVGLFLFEPHDKALGSIEAIRKYADASVLRSLAKALGSADAVDVLRPALFGVSGPFMMGGMAHPGEPSCCEVLSGLLGQKGGGVQSLDLEPRGLREMSFHSYIVALTPLAEDQITQIHNELKAEYERNYAGAAIIKAALETAPEITASLHLGLYSRVTGESVKSGQL